jgi:hypothetical protein
MTPFTRGSGRLGLAFVAASLLLAACGDDEKSPQEKFWASYADLYCNGVAPCCKATGQANDVDACRQFVGVLGIAFSKGKFSQANADQCLSELRAWDCNTDTPDSCSRIFEGTVQPGGSCSTSQDCARPVDGDVTCHWTGSSSSDGTCKTVPTPATGQPCGFDAYTDTEYYKCEDDPALYCDNGTCSARIALGQPCASGSCVAGATCASDSTSTQTVCVAQVAVGGDCSSVECVDEAYCDSSSNLCVAKKAEGEACTTFSECLGFCDSDTSKCVGSSSSAGVSCFTQS